MASNVLTLLPLIALPLQGPSQAIVSPQVADPFSDTATSAEESENVDPSSTSGTEAPTTTVPTPDGPEWEAPPYTPPPPPPPPSEQSANSFVASDSYDPPRASAPESPAAEKPGKSLITAGLVVVGFGVATGALSYYTYSERKAAEISLDEAEAMNAGLVAAGLPPQNTEELQDEVDLNRSLSIGFGIGAAVLAVAGGVTLLVGVTRKNRQAQAVTLRPTAGGIEVQF